MPDYGILGTEERVDAMVSRLTVSTYRLYCAGDDGERYLGDAQTWDGVKQGVRLYLEEEPAVFPIRVERDRVHSGDWHLDAEGRPIYRSARGGYRES